MVNVKLKFIGLLGSKQKVGKDAIPEKDDAFTNQYNRVQQVLRDSKSVHSKFNRFSR